MGRAGAQADLHVQQQFFLHLSKIRSGVLVDLIGSRGMDGRKVILTSTCSQSPKTLCYQSHSEETQTTLLSSELQRAHEHELICFRCTENEFVYLLHKRSAAV